MRLTNILALAATLTITQHTLAQEVRQVTVGDDMNFGITYSLPKTVVRANIEAQCTRSVAGQYAAYAEKFLGLSDVILEDQTCWEIQHITLTNVAKADSARTFHIEFSEKGALPTFYLTDERCLWAINQKPVEETKSSEPVRPGMVTPVKPTLKASDVLTGEILKAGSKVKQAELIAQEIFSIRESRTLLIKGEADNMPGDGASLQLMLDNLTAQEEALLSLFVGTTSVSTKSYQVDYVPEASKERDLFFRFSEHLGMVENDDLAGSPYYISVLMVEDNRTMVVDDKSRKKAAGKAERGIAFCIPGKAQVTLFDANQTLASGEMSLAQFGHVEQLPVSQFTDKKKPSSALFTPTTGAIRIFDQSAQ